MLRITILKQKQEIHRVSDDYNPSEENKIGSEDTIDLILTPIEYDGINIEKMTANIYEIQQPVINNKPNSDQVTTIDIKEILFE